MTVSSHTFGVQRYGHQRIVIASLWYRALVAGTLLILCLLTIGGIYDPVPSATGPKWPGWVIAGILAALMVRSARLGVVIQHRTVTTRGFLRTRRVQTSRVERVTDIGYSGLINWGGESRTFRMLRLQLQDGERDLPMVVARPRTARLLAATATKAVHASAATTK